MPERFAEVAVNSALPHRQTFSYSIPDGMDVVAGSAVHVPFGRQTLQGVVLEAHDTPVFSEPEKIRPVRALLGDGPLLDTDRVALAHWIADYYIAPVYDSVALLLPPGFGQRSLTYIRPLVASSDLDAPGMNERQRQVLAALVARGRTELDELRGAVAGTIDNALVQLERRGLIAREYALARPRIAAKTIEIARLAADPATARARIDAAETPKPSRRAALLERLLAKRAISDAEAIRLAGSRANMERLMRDAIIRTDRDAHSVTLAISHDDATAYARTLRRTARAEAAHNAVAALAADGDLSLPALRSRGIDTPVARWLASLGVIEIREEAVERDPLDEMHVVPRAPATLLPAQAAAADVIVAALQARRHETFLLHGVTGSGKTEVYLQALDRCVADGRRAIVLVPEIALTPQTIRRFRERFERVAVLHSALTDGERFDQWHGIAAGRFDVVIGPRSAIFAPQPDLALIVIDEEHEWTYKQNDPAPRYSARDVAVELARLKRAVVVLGSATPDVASYDAAARGAYTLLSLPERIRPVTGADGVARPETSAAMPRIDVIDLREELHAGNRSMFSGELRAAIEQALAADEQAILFLNRRGLAGHVQCRDCGYVPACGSCFVALTYHRQYDRLVCHQCNRQQRLPVACRQCGSPRVRLMGAGVEKVEAEAARAFPHARLLRWDRDATRTRNAHERILASFLAHEADILIGTQMVAKGLDMPAVTVVGVVNADVGLHLPDFRAGERTFQLLTQVAGRAGRGERAGRVIIQTYQPDHYAIDAASRYDYEGFAATELAARRENRYPPYTRLVRLTYSHTNPKFAREEALRTHRALAMRRSEMGSDAELLGPSPAYVPRVRGRWRWQIVARGSDPASLVRGFLFPQHWTIDVDPASLV